jgi:hypothetical protein
MCFQKVVQEYERAVIFRLGRLLERGAKGPGELVQADAWNFERKFVFICWYAVFLLLLFLFFRIL